MTDIFGQDFFRTTRRLGAMASGVQPPDVQPMPGEQPMPYTPHQPQQQRQRSIFDEQRKQEKMAQKQRDPFGLTNTDTPDLVKPKVPIKPGYAGIL